MKIEVEKNGSNRSVAVLTEKIEKMQKLELRDFGEFSAVQDEVFQIADLKTCSAQHGRVWLSWVGVFFSSRSAAPSVRL